MLNYYQVGYTPLCPPHCGYLTWNKVINPAHADQGPQSLCLRTIDMLGHYDQAYQPAY